MESNSYCEDLVQLDFKNFDNLYLIMSHDKYARIEGLCSEAVFIDEIVKDNLEPFTNNFWFTQDGENNYRVRKLIIDQDLALTPLDYRLLDIFTAPDTGIQTDIVYFNESTRKFYTFPHTHKARYPNLNNLGTPMEPNLYLSTVESDKKNEERLKLACEYLQKHGLLKKAALGRLFANGWLEKKETCKGIYDVDAFTVLDDDRIIALEVKHKYMTAGKTFGINDGQLYLYMYLHAIGIPSINVILEKPVRDASISAIRLITEKQYTESTLWKMSPIRFQHTTPAVTLAPATSGWGRKGVRFSHIDEKRYPVLKKFGEKSIDIKRRLSNILIE